MPLRIEHYAMIGDCHSAGLIGRDGSIDWLCWPRFDSAACFAALLGTTDNGRWLIATKDARVTIKRRYRPGTPEAPAPFSLWQGRHCTTKRAWPARTGSVEGSAELTASAGQREAGEGWLTSFAT
jgi:hypothetical protein